MSAIRSLALYLWAIVMLLVWAFAPSSWAVRDASGAPQTVTVISSVSSWAILLVFVASLFALFRAARPHGARIWKPVLAYTLVFLAGSFSVGIHMLQSWSNWEIRGRASDAQGNSYVYSRVGLMNRQVVVVAKVATDNLLFTRLEVLASNKGDGGAVWVSVVRAASESDEFGQVILTDQGMVIGNLRANQCYVAYDLHKKKAYGEGSITGLPPFAALGANDEPHARDLASLSERQTGAAVDRGRPLPAALRKDLSHKNPRAQAEAKRLLEALESEP